MKATYDAKTDTLSIILKPDAQVAESDEDKPGVLLDYDNSGSGDEDNAVHGELKARDVGRSFEADYTGARRLGVVYVRDGDAYQPDQNEPELPSCW